MNDFVYLAVLISVGSILVGLLVLYGGSTGAPAETNNVAVNSVVSLKPGTINYIEIEAGNRTVPCLVSVYHPYASDGMAVELDCDWD